MKKLVFIIFCFSLTQSIYPQYQNVRISGVNYPAETSIAIDPNNPNRMVAGANINANGVYGCGYYYSTNAGLNWTEGILSSDSGKPYCDPGIAVDKLGNFYYTADASFVGSPPPYLAKLYCMKSVDGGANWLTGVFGWCAPKMADMPTMCIDLSNSAFQNNIYVVYTVADTIHTNNTHNDSSAAYFCRSTDQGVTFSVPIRISKRSGIGIGFFNSYLEGCICCTGSSGEIYTAWVDSLGISFDRSTDGGLTWLDNDIFISPLAGGWANITGYGCGYTGTPWMDCDISYGPNRGTIYLAWSDNSSGTTKKDIWLVKSQDRGNSWGTPVRVNNDPVAENKSHFFAHLAVDQTNGNLYAAFYDNRNYANNYNTDVYLARSTDGGQTFANTKVNSAPISLCSIYYGDYIGLAVCNNKVRPVWTANLSGDQSAIWTAIVDTFVIGIQKLSDAVPQKFALCQNYPNPFNPVTRINYDVPKKGFVKLVIFDAMGKEVAILANEIQEHGTYQAVWDASDFSSGVYFYKLISGNFSQTKKMVLLK